MIKSFIINDYHHSIHGTTKETPLALWNKHQIIPQMPESLEKLNLLLLTAKKSTIVQRDGIRFSGLRYFHPNLVAYVGECITIRFDPSDLAEIWVYDEQNKCICKAVCEEFQDQSITYEELRRIRTNRKKELKQEIKSKVSNIKQLIHEEEKQESKFISTKEYKKFEELCNSCKDYKYIGLCYGAPGIGKTLSANQYSNWKQLKSYHDCNFRNFFYAPELISIPSGILECDTIIKTASATNTPARIEKGVFSDAYILKFMKDFTITKKVDTSNSGLSPLTDSMEERFSGIKLIIVDEVDHLKYTSLEQLRNIYDRFEFGMVFIGMPGIERRFSRYPQLYSRVGFLHEFKPLSRDEMTFIIENHLNQLGTKISMDNFSDYETLNTIVRITKGNFRVLTRLFQQLERLMKVNNVASINTDLVNSAREVLVVGS